MNEPHLSWERLVARARRAPGEPAVAAPPGFATRLVARAFACPEPTAEVLLARFALRGFFVALTFSFASVVLSYSALTASGDPETAAGDSVAELLAQS